ncbi:S1 family peptidase [Dolichospermum heterosporum]|uniref:Serine protease n=1 Tax=Dolichospermum heterosporum TAC447 TaxID=747523 RepID=A0ABY5LRH7_9CYAN|nr:serine protease [Dolichospermum heterosporum]UUO14558.1 serine protease [Dolichospermum heterosporum TAC447]
MANEENLRGCTVRLNFADSQGTGFFVAAGYILTCAHVVESARDKDNPVQVYWKSEDRDYTARVEQLYEYHIDLALLKLEGDDFNHPCVELDGTKPNVNDDLYIFGYPKDGETDYSQGDSASFKYVGPSYSYKDNILLYKLKQGQVKSGFSGSPLLNLRTGKVCGIVHLSLDESTDLGGRAVSAEVILQKFPKIAQLNKQFHQQKPNVTKEDRDNMNKSPLSKEDRDKLKEFLFNSGLADSPNQRRTLCRNLDIFEIARRRNLTEKEENNFVTELVEWLHDIYHQKALNNLCEEIKPYCTNETLLNILLNIQTKIALPTIPKVN